MLSSVPAQQILASARRALSALTTRPWYLSAVTHMKHWHRPTHAHTNLDPEARAHTCNSTRLQGVKDRSASPCPGREQLSVHIVGVVAAWAQCHISKKRDQCNASWAYFYVEALH